MPVMPVMPGGARWCRHHLRWCRDAHPVGVASSTTGSTAREKRNDHPMAAHNIDQIEYDREAGAAFRAWRFRLPREDERSSQKGAAQQIGVVPAALCQWETGARRCKADTRARIAESFGVAVRDIWPDAPELTAHRAEGGSDT